MLAQVSRPYDVPKILLLAVMGALCLLQVLFLANWYFLEPMISHLAVFYLPMLALIWPVQKLIRLLLDHEIFWWNRHSQGAKPLSR